uniref:Uncharacterized protein n=1 Tax=Siphoviridae sp. ct5Px37 TaxID=2826293 RepID=A0A8S5N4K4_9CAUD|nr:MAG TPA: hypothetical protein [Siphoviridae sp. ct5Px37]
MLRALCYAKKFAFLSSILCVLIDTYVSTWYNIIIPKERGGG